MNRIIYLFGILFGVPAIALAILPGAVLTVIRRRLGRAPRLVWVGVPVNSHADVSRAMRAVGYETRSIATERYAQSDGSRYDHWIPLRRRLPKGLNALAEQVRAYGFSVHALLTADILHGFFDGGFLRRTALREHEYWLWKLAGKRLVLMPYGRDSFVYSDMPPDELKTITLKATYPQTPAEDAAVRRRLARFSTLADVVVGAVGHTVCLPRVDVWTVLWYPGNLALEPVWPSTRGPIRIAHASNHRGVKGTDELIAAIERLRARGHDIRLDVIEGVPNHQVLERFARVDIVVDQLYEGYALAAVEAMSLGKVVISALESPAAHGPFRERSYLGDCPIVSATTATIEGVLAGLIARRSAWPELGQRTHKYARTWHSPDASVRLFEGIYDRIWFANPPARPRS